MHSKGHCEQLFDKLSSENHEVVVIALRYLQTQDLANISGEIVSKVTALVMDPDWIIQYHALDLLANCWKVESIFPLLEKLSNRDDLDPVVFTTLISGLANVSRAPSPNYPSALCLLYQLGINLNYSATLRLEAQLLLLTLAGELSPDEYARQDFSYKLDGQSVDQYLYSVLCKRLHEIGHEGICPPR